MSQQQNLLEPSSLATSSYFVDRRHYRPLRLFTPAPYRSPFHTSSISLRDIKEATNEENNSSCSNFMEHNDQKSVNFHDHNIRESPEQNLKPESINNLVVVDHQFTKKNEGITRRCCDKSLETPWSTDTSKPYTTIYPSESIDMIRNWNQTSRCIGKMEKPPASIIAVQIIDPKSHRRIICTNQNETYCSNESKIVHEENSNFKYHSDLNVPPQKSPDALESPRSCSSDSSKQPKSILKQRSVPLLSPSFSNTNNNNLERYLGKIQINDGGHEVEKLHYQNQSYNNSGHVNQPNLHSVGRENKLYQVMQENLRQQKLLRPQTSHHLPHASFNGPFFTLEEVHNKQQRGSLEMHQVPVDDYCLTRKQQQNSADDSSYNLKYDNRSKSVSAMEVNVAELEKINEIGENVVHCPSPPIKHEHQRARSVPPSLRTRNITDPDRINEYYRQKEFELEAIRRKKEEAIAWKEKQMRALEIQERLYYQQMQARRNRSSSELDESMTQSREELRQIDMGAQKWQNELSSEKSLEPRLMHVYETRPITITSEEGEQQEFTGLPNPVTWKRLYIVEQSKPIAKNEIITSEQLLEKERFDIDLLKRREVFIEKPKPEPVIFRIGKRWKPPSELPYIWPCMRKALNAESSLGSSSSYSTDNAAGRAVENVEFRWQPTVYDPEYKQERKNFTPGNSLPGTPRGFGPGPLDEPAKRQIKHLVQPLPDGSHRPKPAFGGPRATPFGGFYPHAPNAIKILKKKHSQNLPESVSSDLDKEVEIIHQRRFHRLGELPSTTTSSQRHDIADWEKIYDLPVHSSTITSRDTPRNVNVRGKLAAFENSLRQATPSVHLHLNSGGTCRPLSSIPAINIDDGLQSPANIIQMNRNGQYLRQQCPRQQLLSTTSTRIDTATASNHQSCQQQRNERQSVSSSGLSVRQINHHNANQSNRTTCSVVHPDTYQQFSREVSPLKLLHPVRDHSEYGGHQHRVPVRSGRTSTPHQHQQVAQSIATPRRLTRLPMDNTIGEQLQSRTSTVTEWQRSSSIGDYLNTRS
ncbi:unnamed protein product [Cercopithifilaria johnstoni]|uniref:Uncharacterized protein n=1 Tax=Cercopithifilaria johnstoni TaxID=2874296 RepID=A0A8J2M1M8_9BILA|nr:unnamed protein product [Cercopithifilaria johnstoni]